MSQRATPVRADTPGGGSEHEGRTSPYRAVSRQSSSPEVPVCAAKRELSWWRIAAIAFVLTCGGPAGIEVVVQQGGYAYALLGLLLLPIVFVIPQILVVSELGAMMPTNAGYVVWVERAFGEAVGFFNAWIVVLTNAVMAATFPIIAGDYMYYAANQTPSGQTAQPTGNAQVAFYAYRGAALVLGTFMSLLSTKHVSYLSALCSVLIIVIGLVVFSASIPNIVPSAWLSASPSPKFAILMTQLLYLYAGWPAMGALAGETSSPKALWYGLSTALLLDVLVFLTALVAAITVTPANVTWHVGYFVTAFDKVISGIGPVFGIAVSLANVANLVGAFVCYSRLLWGCAEMGWAPAIFRTQLASGAPVYGVIANALVSAGLIWFHLGIVVNVLYTVIGVSMIIFFAAFVKLRYSEPDTDRPFLVPGGKPVAWLLFVVQTSVMATTCIAGIASRWEVAVAFFAVNLSVMLAYVIFRSCGGRPEVAPFLSGSTPNSQGGGGECDHHEMADVTWTAERRARGSPLKARTAAGGDAAPLLPDSQEPNNGAISGEQRIGYGAV